MKPTAFILSLLLSQLGWSQQQKLLKNLSPTDTDSCIVSLYKVTTKEMSKPGEEPSERLLAQHKMPRTDHIEILKKLVKKSSYSEDRALLTHHNIVYTFYKENEVQTHIELSSITGNITVSDTNSEPFYGNVSKKFGRYLMQQLRKYELLTFLSSNDLRGLNKELD